jgi:hypothetical protein
MSFKCGSCGRQHDFAWEARECAGVAVADTSAGTALDAMDGTQRTFNPPSMAQVNYVIDLLRKHEWPDEISHDDLRAMERRQVSRLIERIKGSPAKPELLQHHSVSANSAWSFAKDVPPGRYALLKTHPNPDDDSEAGDYDFYQVDKPTEGKWAGSIFLRHLFGAPGDYHKEAVTGALKMKVLKKIAADPEKSSLTYGRVSEVCGVCHSPLTNKTSRDAGIGPVCAKKTGWGL